MKFNLGSFKVNGSPLAYFFELSADLFVMWILLSGRFEARLLIMGGAFALVTAYVCASFLTVKNEKTGKKYFLPEVNIFKLGAYYLWLMWEIFLSGLVVTKAVFKKSYVEPRIVYFLMDYQNPTASALLATSITLTPGTITLDVNEQGVFEVYALTEASAQSVLDGRMQEKIKAIYREECTFNPLPELELRYIPKEID